jgi:hypothetical protein
MRAAQSKGVADLLALFPASPDWRWLAGVYDGEGSTTVNRATSARSAPGYVWEGLLLSITQKDRRLLDRVATNIGGRISGPYKNADWCQLRISGKAALPVLAGMYPHLSPQKQEQAMTVLDRLGLELPPQPFAGAVLVQCKYSIHGGGHLPGKDAIELVALAELTGALPVFARPGPKGRGVEFTNLYSKEIIV